MKFFKLEHEVLTISIDNENILLHSWNVKKSKFTLNAFFKYEIKNFELINLKIFNFTQIEAIINSFLIDNNIANPFVYLSLISDTIQEQLTNDLKLVNFNDNFNYNQLCLNDELENYYIAAIDRAVLFQYQLLFIKLNLNLKKIGTELLSLININNLNIDIYKITIDNLTINKFKDNLINSINFDYENYITNLNAIKKLNKLELAKSLGIFIKEYK